MILDIQYSRSMLERTLQYFPSAFGHDATVWRESVPEGMEIAPDFL
jgi:hypothetical protein